MRVEDRSLAGAANGEADLPEAMSPAGSGRFTPWQRSLFQGGIAYVLSRLFVIGAAGVVAASKTPKPVSAAKPIIDVLTSWDGLWYLEVVRRGYPSSVPPHITFFQLEARAAFFPLYPLLVRGADRILPGGDTAAALTINAILGVLVIFAIGLLARALKGDRVAGRTMVLVALFPGSFVLSFAYSEAAMLLLAALCLLALLRKHWVTAGLLAAVATASRPNAIALVAAAAVAAFLAIRRDRDWRSLAAPILAPIGAIAYMVYLWARTGEAKVWFRIQGEAWHEGVSFGWTAIRSVGEFVAHPFDSAVKAVTTVCLLALVGMLAALWKAKLPAPVVAYTLVIVGLMLLPNTVTARPRFLITAFPLLIAVAAVWPERDRDWWGMLLAACSAALVGLVVTYGLLAAIP